MVQQPKNKPGTKGGFPEMSDNVSQSLGVLCVCVSLFISDVYLCTCPVTYGALCYLCVPSLCVFCLCGLRPLHHHTAHFGIRGYNINCLWAYACLRNCASLISSNLVLPWQMFGITQMCMWRNWSKCCVATQKLAFSVSFIRKRRLFASKLPHC